MSFDLFSGLNEGPSIIESSDSDEEKFVTKAWKTWSKATNRPPRSVPDNVEKWLKQLYNERLSLNDSMRVVTAASYLEPHRRDPSDTGRLVSAIKSKNVRKSALSIMDSGESEAIEFRSHEDNVKVSAVEIEKACGVPISLWSERDHASAGHIASRCDLETLQRVAGEVKSHLGEDAVFPAEMARHSKIWSDPSAKLSRSSASSRSTYASGASESDVLSGVDTDADPVAGHMLLSGNYTAEQVARFHNDVPDGYWSAVQEVMDADLSVTAKTAYDMVASRFGGFDPSSRSME